MPLIERERAGARRGRCSTPARRSRPRSPTLRRGSTPAAVARAVPRRARGRDRRRPAARGGATRAATSWCLSGGVFQNRLLLERTAALLREAGMTVLVPERLPPNDGGISYGQAAVAAATARGMTRRSDQPALRRQHPEPLREATRSSPARARRPARRRSSATARRARPTPARRTPRALSRHPARGLPQGVGATVDIVDRQLSERAVTLAVVDLGAQCLGGPRGVGLSPRRGGLPAASASSVTTQRKASAGIARAVAA